MTTLATQDLVEIKLHGRGGQGIVTAGDILARAAFLGDRHAQSIPSFGPERRGGATFCSLRVSTRPIRLRCSVATPQVVMVIDETVWRFVNVAAGLQPGGILLFNSQLEPDAIAGQLASGKLPYRLDTGGLTIAAVDATGIAMACFGKPIANTAMMGAFCRVTGLLELNAVQRTIADHVSRYPEENVAAAGQGYERVITLS